MGPKKGSHQVRMLRMGSFEMISLVSHYAGVAQDRFSEIPGSNPRNAHAAGGAKILIILSKVDKNRSFLISEIANFELSSAKTAGLNDDCLPSKEII